MAWRIGILIALFILTGGFPATGPRAADPGEIYRFCDWRVVDGDILVSMNVKQVDLRQVIEEFGRMARLNVVFWPNVTGTVTARLKDVPWRDALRNIAEINRVEISLEGNVMMVTARPAPGAFP